MVVLTPGSGPFNLEQGNSTNFTVEYFDVNGNLALGVSPMITVAYTNTSNSSQTDTITLTPLNNFYIGTWSSTSASLGLATWITYSGGNQVETGLFRVIQRKAN